MNSRFCVYKEATGEIVALYDMEAQFQAHVVGDDENIIAGHPPGHWLEYHVALGEYAARPTLPQPTSNYDLSALPSATVVQVLDESGTLHEITDMSEMLVLEGPQVYSVKILPPFPYMSIEARVEVE